MITKAPRGTADILPADMPYWRYVTGTAAKVATAFGFREIKTPVFEHTELFERGVGDTTDVVTKEMYTFLDKADRSITLRPEGTACAARAYLEHSMQALPQPVKLYYDIACYRYEKPQAGRLREFHQFGIEVFGGADAAVDAEVIALADTIFKTLGIDSLELNINSIGCPECRKKYNEALIKYLKANVDGLCPTCIERLEKNPMRIIDCKNPPCKEIAKGAPHILDFICDECSEHFDKTKSYLDKMGIKYTVDPTIVRGLDYYTKTVFEFVSKEIGAQGTVCGGGRYDGLIEMLGGKATPGMGFATGIERIILVLKALNIKVPNDTVPSVYVASIGCDEDAMALTYKLRKAGINAECDTAGRSLKAQMKNADRLGARYSVVLGEDEISAGSATFKNMADKTTAQLKLDNIDDIKDFLASKEEK